MDTNQNILGQVNTLSNNRTQAGDPRQATLGPKSPFLEAGSNQSARQPRALRSLAQIISGNLCHRCGSCVGICPTGVLGLDEREYPFVKSLSACTDCTLCVKVCPGDEFDYQRHYKARFGENPDLTHTHGHFIEAYIGYATLEGLRESSTSGGAITAILLHLLQSGKIDGAVVVVSDDHVLWKGRPILARTSEEILSATKSKYAIAPTNSVLSELRSAEGRFALVGLPCQIHGFMKAAELDPRLREKVALTVGLYCHAAIEHEAYEVIWKTLGDRTEGARGFISRVGKHPGTPHLVQKDGSLYPVYFGWKRGYRPSSIEVINVLYRLFTPPRCLTCFDASSEFADISVGDPWMAPPADDVNFYDGWSYVLARTEKGRDACHDAATSGSLALKELTRREALSCNTMMTNEKRWRAFRIMETHLRQGRPVPSYGSAVTEFPRRKGLQFVKTELNMITHSLCFLPSLRGPVLALMLSNWGYALFWINHKRRSLRNWLRDSRERLRRRLRGRK